MLFELLSASGPAAAVPVCLVAESQNETWLESQPAHVRQWLALQRFEAKKGQVVQVPGSDGGLDRVVAAVAEPVSMWDLAALPAALPQGLYRLDTTLGVEEQEKLALGWALGGYCFDHYKKAEKPPAAKLYIPDSGMMGRVAKLAQAVSFVRDLITTPAADMGPEQFATAIQGVARRFGAKTSIIVGDDLLKKNYPAIHAVGRASSRPPRLVDLTWGNPSHPRVTLVGKGVCFDTGGLDVKNSSGMFLMRKDMGGAAVALGVASLIMENKLPVRLRLLVPAVENAVAGNAYRASDIITMRNGTNVEVGNTDAEGRLVLADALTEAMSEDPDLVVDFSTLTGAARVAVGTGISAFFTPSDALAEGLYAMGRDKEDPVWRLPLFEGYETMLDTPFASVNSCPDTSYAGAITAALFLQRFVGKNKPWIHLDFMAWNGTGKSGRPEGGEAMSMRAIFALIEQRYAIR